jgi:hypothetical protein
MTLLETVSDGLRERHGVVVVSLLAGVMTLAAVAWWRTRCAASRRPHVVDRREWRFCGRCGWPRPDNGSPPLATRPIRDAITVAGTATPDTRTLPSVLLRQGWTRAAAVDAQGRIVTPCWPTAVAWSIWGAINKAYEPGGEVWKAAHRHLTEIIAERGGGCTVSAQRWNRAAGRSHSEILMVSDEVQRRLASEPRP